MNKIEFDKLLEQNNIKGIKREIALECFIKLMPEVERLYYNFKNVFVDGDHIKISLYFEHDIVVMINQPFFDRENISYSLFKNKELLIAGVDTAEKFINNLIKYLKTWNITPKI